MTTSGTFATAIGLALASLFGGWAGPALAGPPVQKSRPVDRAEWARRLASLDDANWRISFATGQELAALPGDDGFAILQANWDKIARVEARQQLLKAWIFALPYPLHIRNHPRLVDGLDLGMRDRSPEVQSWAADYLGNLAFRDFAEDLTAYKAWYQASRDQPISELIARSARRFATEAAGSDRADATRRARWLAQHGAVLRDIPEARQAAIDAGLTQTLGRWAAAPDIELAIAALSALGQLKPGEAELRRSVVPSLDPTKPTAVRVAAIAALEGQENAWAVDLLLEELSRSLAEKKNSQRATTSAAAVTLATIGDPRAIPTMIAVIDADNTYETVYGVGYFGLGRLTGVPYDETHNGPWWRQWWEQNKGKYPPAVQALEIPRPKQKP